MLNALRALLRSRADCNEIDTFNRRVMAMNIAAQLLRVGQDAVTTERLLDATDKLEAYLRSGALPGLGAAGNVSLLKGGVAS